ncbi:hypothetical protein CSUNSWCD_588 [Campylobacter showae CSUNSWCD]|uniref:Uncharacterized protein n=1 Tax=Campylobacter showae CSUNSWCD TaxID=1244083 RepID=M5IEF8_9BACT|nr:hypothetical protein CSUNSWCD_588 [Campylobacter showae CSUNSWCD]
MLLHCVQVYLALSRRTFFKFAFLWCGSRRLKFANLSVKQ